MNEHVLMAGFTGSRYGLSFAQSWGLEHRLRELHRLGYTHFGHGDCVGSDSEAHDIARLVGFKIWIYPPSDPSLRAFREPYEKLWHCDRYLARNRNIVRHSAVLIGCPQRPPEFDMHGGWVRNGGTYYTLEYARTRPGWHGAICCIYEDGTEWRQGEPPLSPRPPV